LVGEKVRKKHLFPLNPSRKTEVRSRKTEVCSLLPRFGSRKPHLVGAGLCACPGQPHWIAPTVIPLIFLKWIRCSLDIPMGLLPRLASLAPACTPVLSAERHPADCESKNGSSQAQVRLLECRRETQGEVLKLRLTACLIASTLMRTKRLFSALANKPSASSGQGLRVLPRVALIWIHTLRPARASQRSPASQSSIGRGLRLTGVGQSPVIERPAIESREQNNRIFCIAL